MSRERGADLGWRGEYFHIFLACFDLILFYLIFMDLHMPVMPGFETIREIREQLYKAMAEAARSGSIASATCAEKPAA